MKLKRFLLRYYPPGKLGPLFEDSLLRVLTFVSFTSASGVILEYELRDHTRELKEIDLLHLTPEYVASSALLDYTYHVLT